MTQRQIKLTIRPDGTIAAKTEGMYGPECEAFTESLERLLIAKARNVERTDDYYRTQPLEESSQVDGTNPS